LAAAAGLSIMVVTAIVPLLPLCVQARGGIPVPSAKAARFVVVCLGPARCECGNLPGATQLVFAPGGIVTHPTEAREEPAVDMLQCRRTALLRSGGYNSGDDAL